LAADPAAPAADRETISPEEQEHPRDPGEAGHAAMLKATKKAEMVHIRLTFDKAEARDVAAHFGVELKSKPLGAEIKAHLLSIATRKGK